MNDDVFAGQPLLEFCLLEWQVAPPLEQRQLQPQVYSSYTYDMWTPNTYTPARGPQTTNLYDSVFLLFSVPNMLVYTCFAAHVSSNMACGNLAAHTALQKHGCSMEVSHDTHTDVLESMSLGHCKYSGLRATCHLPLQIQWSESNMIRNMGICSSILLVYTPNSTHVQRNAYTPGLCEFLKIYTWLVYTQKSGFL